LGTIFGIKLCKENNMAFVCLPPNSTNKLQPLDFGVFAPFKKAWRQVLSNFKKEHPKQVRIPKSLPSPPQETTSAGGLSAYLAAT
jgi:hypothetical protein